MLRHVLLRMRARDPEFDALRRAARAAIMLPISAAVGFAVGGGSQTPLFTIFGTVALLIMVDFPGNRPARALAYGGLGLNGAVLIALGTVVAPHPLLSVAVMFVLGAAVTFAGVLSEIVAAGQRATLLMFVLPACTPVGPLPERLLGWVIALALCVPAAMFLFPPRHHDDLRRNAARVCNRLADRLEGTASARDVTKAMNALYETFIGADYRPVALTAGSRALVRVVDDLGWLSDQITEDTGRRLGAMKKPAVRVLRDSAAVLRLRSPAARAARSDDLREALIEQRSTAQGTYRDDIAQMLSEADDAAAVEVGRALLNRRTVSATIAVTGRIIRNAAAADARPVWARVLGRRLPETGAADWVMPETVAVAAITKGFLGTRAVVLRNSLRTGLGLALAVAVTHVFPVEHGFWVVLGAMSVLRSSALTTGTRVLRAVAGTAVGFVLGAFVIEMLGVDPVVLWILLPLVAFGSAYVPEVASFVAGQAAFTMMVLINFNLIVPTGWQVGLIRVEDVVVGALVGVVVSVLLWPRGRKDTGVRGHRGRKGHRSKVPQGVGIAGHPRRVGIGTRSGDRTQPRRSKCVPQSGRRCAPISFGDRRANRHTGTCGAGRQPRHPAARGRGTDRRRGSPATRRVSQDAQGARGPCRPDQRAGGRRQRSAPGIDQRRLRARVARRCSPR